MALSGFSISVGIGLAYVGGWFKYQKRYKLAYVVGNFMYQCRCRYTVSLYRWVTCIPVALV